MHHTRYGAALLLTGAVAVLSGCGFFGGGGEKKLVCPASFVAPDADKQAVFKPGGATLKDVRYGIEITGVKSACVRADKGLAVDTKVGFHLVATDPSVRAGSFQYFVSIVDGQQNILTKKIYSMPFEFDARMRDLNRQDELIESLPLLNPGTGGDYAVVVGLQLTPEQLQFNRVGSRPPALSVQPAPVSIPPKPGAGNSALRP